MQCGIACLAMLCRVYGRNVSMRLLSKYCHATTEGVSLLGIKSAAEKMGFEAKAVHLHPDEISEIPLPTILHWNQNHFVVLHRVDFRRGLYHVADPANGLRRYKREDFLTHWRGHGDSAIPGSGTDLIGVDKGIALLMEPGEDFVLYGGDEGERRSFGFLMGYLRQYRKYFVQIILGLALGCVLQLIMPFMTQAIVDIGIRQQNIGIIWLILLGELLIVIGRTATDFVRRWLLLHISMRINISLVSDFFIKLLKLPMSFFDTKLLGDLLQRIGDHTRVQNFLTKQVLNIIFSLLSFVVFGMVLLVYNPLIFAVFVAGSAIYGVWIAFFLHRRKVLDYEMFEQQAANQNKTYQLITSMQEIKLHNCERRRRWEWEDTQANLFVVQMKSLQLQQTQEAGSIFINEAKNILITVLAATAVINGDISLGAMLAVQYIVGQLNSPIEQLMSFVYSLQDVKISLERINEIHEDGDEESETRGLREFATSACRSISLRDVCFRYDPHSPKKTIDTVSFDIPYGKLTAIVGASGSGKTTLIKLMLGYYPTESGKISIADKTLSDYSPQWWRKQCGVVMQDGVIFSESIARNIAVDDAEIDYERLYSAARIAEIHDYTMSLPQKYNTIVGRDGVSLSQGQKQRILIARAVYRNPTFIFLDEATNSLDARNERAIVENLNAFYEGRTVVVVAHRLSTVRNADQIIVIDEGRVAEIGTHATLIARSGAYYNLVRNQLELGN